MKKRYAFAALCAIGWLSACSGGQKAQEVKDEKPKVKLASVTTRPVDQIQEYTATVEAYATNNIAPASPVRIEKIYVEVGDRVGKGQKLVQMDASGLKQLKLQLDNQTTEFTRIDELYKIGGVSKSEWEASKMTLEMRQTSYKNMLENTALVSPISGVVTARNYDSGDMYGGGIPVVTVEQIMPVKLLINVSESYFTRIAKNSTVSVKFDVYGEEEFEGKVHLLYPTIDPTTRTFVVEIRLDNRDMRVRPGMFARVTLNFGTADHVIIPDKAIIKQPGSGERYVYVYQDSVVYRKVVQLGRRMNDEYEIISGVDSDARVVISGQYHSSVKDSARVEVVQ
ncbi:efflux RND transporter periplasmic adaptor subunit [Tannerella sp.]|uniref:efflux RND transporter periplasmic adaptor subunit n=1 Tax=Tannerella sp. TaxID=2382127 RepID=UPI0026DD4157|nr:efflux RND transporter periplasmic adaptor subunit [Tannerella sp.]MDO4702667.1 efflux RND transporter periplasmic adaptor subunit [Tannerella sp.]